jgi:aminocarboxymuconate-semialdehyde decarboxylase
MTSRTDNGKNLLECEPGSIFAIPPALTSPDELIADLQQMGVGAAVLSPPPFIFNYHLPVNASALLADSVNSGLAGMAESYPRFFRAMGLLPMQDPDLALEALDRGMDRYGLRGFEIGSHIAGRNLDHPDFYPVFARAEEKKAIIFIHPWDPMGGDRFSRPGLKSVLGIPMEAAAAGLCLILGGVMDRFPGLRFFLAHGGGALPYLAGRLKRFAEVRGVTALNRKPEEYLRSIYYDSIVLSDPALQCLLTVAGPEQVLLGSDFPYHLGDTGDPQALQSIKNIQSLWAGNTDYITCLNALKLFFG